MILENIDSLIDEVEFIDENEYVDEGLTIGQKVGVGILLSSGKAGIPVIPLTGYLIYRYFTSINFIKKRITDTEVKLKNTTDPVIKEKLTNKLKELEAKLEQSKARARDERRNFIAKMKQTKEQIDSLNKKESLTDSEKKKLESLKNKLSKGQTLLQKIGAEI